MSENIFNIKSRIFKRERVRENKNNLVIVSKRNENVEKNQIELTFNNASLETAHLFIVGRVVIKEWERLLSKYPVTRSFMQIREGQQVRLYISFQVGNDLSGREIKSIISLVTEILEECLEKVVIKADKELPIKESEVTSEKSIEEITDDQLITTNNELINQLHQEIEEQENLLKELAAQQDNLVKPIVKEEAIEEEVLVINEETIEPISESTAIDNQKEELITVLDLQVVSLKQEVKALKQELKQKQAVNVELDKANIKLNEMLQQSKVNESKLAEVSSLEKKYRETSKENSDYRKQLNESQHMIEQYKNSNTHLNDSFERLEMTHDEFIEKAQIDINKLEEELKESEKQKLIEVNNRQKLEIQLAATREKLGQEIRANEKREEKVKQLNLDLSRQLKQREQAINETEQLELKIDQLESDLKLSNVTNDILKEELVVLEGQKEKFDRLNIWETKYEELETKFNELEKESLGYRQEIHLLNSQLKSIEQELEASALEKESISYTVKTETEEKQSDPFEMFNSDDDFLYEDDPFVEEVITEELMNIRKKDQTRDEKEIKEYLEAYYEDGFKDIKVDKGEYRKHVLSFKFLSFRWSQVYIINESDKNAAFLEWCSPFIDKIESFEEELSFDVKKSFFAKNYVTMDESTYEILQGYSKLSTYLDTYYLKVSYYIDKYFLNEGNRENNAK